jgi:hypothetical protein
MTDTFIFTGTIPAFPIRNGNRPPTGMKISIIEVYLRLDQAGIKFSGMSRATEQQVRGL